MRVMFPKPKRPSFPPSYTLNFSIKCVVWWLHLLQEKFVGLYLRCAAETRNNKLLVCNLSLTWERGQTSQRVFFIASLWTFKSCCKIKSMCFYFAASFSRRGLSAAFVCFDRSLFWLHDMYIKPLRWSHQQHPSNPFILFGKFPTRSVRIKTLLCLSVDVCDKAHSRKNRRTCGMWL